MGCHNRPHPLPFDPLTMSTPAQSTPTPNPTPNAQTPVQVQPELKEWTFGDVVDFRYKFDGYEGVWRIQFSQANINQTLNSLLREIGNNIMGSLNVPDTHELSLDMKVDIQPGAEGDCAYTPIRTLRDRSFLVTYTTKLQARANKLASADPVRTAYDLIYPTQTIRMYHGCL